MLRTQSKAVLASLLMGVASVVQPVRAAPVPDLYIAQVPATALSGPALDEAFGLALDQVLVKVTGQRGIAADPSRRRAVGPPAPLVRQYQPVAGGQVRVSFDPAALLRRLDSANLPVWADDRPLALVVLPPDFPAVAAPVGGSAAAGSATAGSATDAGRPSRQLLATAASRGIPVVLAPEPAGGEGADPLLDPQGAMRAAGADVLLVGRPLRTAGPAALRWTLVQGADRAEWQGDMADGAHGLADRLAARYATAAAAARTLRLRILGVDSFDAYGRLQSYLRTVGLVQNADLREVTDGELVFDVTVRGDVRQLNDAFALRRVLEPAGEAQAGGDLVYRLVSGSMSSGSIAAP